MLIVNKDWRPEANVCRLWAKGLVKVKDWSLKVKDEPQGQEMECQGQGLEPLKP